MTSTDYRKPYRPLPVRAFNWMGRAGSRVGLSAPLCVGSLLRRASRKTGLADFGGDEALSALDVLVRSMNDEARLTATGRLIQKARLSSLLVHRLRIEDLLERRPEIGEIDLGTVVLITGLQRTGTTLLQRLLNSHPIVRGISGAEALDPLGSADPSARAQRAHRRRAALARRAVSYLAPEFMAIHPIDHEEPEEDVLLLDLCFMSQSAEATMHVPSYSGWLERQDHAPAYEYFRRVLKVLCRRRSGRALVLKTPHHMEYLDVFLRVFPGATVVQTHRDPRRALASFCSMVAHGRGILSDSVDPAEIGRHWRRKTQRMVERAMRTRAGAPAGRFVDVSYYDLTRDPLGELRRISRSAGLGFDEGAEREAVRCLQANPKNRFGTHTYRLEDFALTEQGVDDTFAPYRETYRIPFE